MTTPYQTGGFDIWPDAEALVVSWLKPNLPDVNVRTETNTTFGTAKPDAAMTLPLVLVQAVSAGHGASTTGRADRITETLTVDLTCYAADRAKAWALYHEAHAWMLRASTQVTPVGTFDDVWLETCMGIVTSSNPALRRVIATYGISARAQATA